MYVYKCIIMSEGRDEDMAKKDKKKKSNNKAEVAKWVAIGAWAMPASGVVDLAKMIVRHLLYNK